MRQALASKLNRAKPTEFHAVLAVADLEASLPSDERLLVLLGFARTRKRGWVNEAGSIRGQRTGQLF